MDCHYCGKKPAQPYRVARMPPSRLSSIFQVYCNQTCYKAQRTWEEENSVSSDDEFPPLVEVTPKSAIQFSKGWSKKE